MILTLTSLATVLAVSDGPASGSDHAAAVPAEQAPTIVRPPAEPSVVSQNIQPPPTQLPQSVRELAEAAFDGGDPGGLSSILKLARRIYPQAVAQIAALEADYAARQAEVAAREARNRAEKLAAASPLENWKGEIELGGSRSTGSTDSVAIYGSLKFEREGLKWRHQLNGRTDVQRSNGATTANRWRFGWQPNFKANDTLFIYGLGQYERDHFLGFDDRYTASTGIGWTILATPKVKLSVEGGPAIRHTDYVDKGPSTTGAGRGSVALRWKITPTLSFSQDTAIYVEDGDHNALTTMAIETRLTAALKARISYDARYEHDDLAIRDPLDTTSRATLVYSF